MNSMLKKKLRDIVRKFLVIRDGETIADGIHRKSIHFIKRFPHKNYGLDCLENDLRKLGISDGDVLIVHSSWNGMYALRSSPNEVVNLLMKMVGGDGTLLMPCYDYPNAYIDLDCFISKAGILSEMLHKKEGTALSEFPKFTMVAYGKHAKEIIDMHSKSTYQFDHYSPYYIAMENYDAKVLMLGMGRNPHKVSVFHCASYDSKDTVLFYKKCYSKKCKCDVKKNGEIRTYDYIDRASEYANDKKVFRKLLAQTQKKVEYRTGYSIIVYNAKDAYDIAYEYCRKGGKIYKS